MLAWLASTLACDDPKPRSAPGAGSSSVAVSSPPVPSAAPVSTVPGPRVKAPIPPLGGPDAPIGSAYPHGGPPGCAPCAQIAANCLDGHCLKTRPCMMTITSLMPFIKCMCENCTKACPESCGAGPTDTPECTTCMRTAFDGTCSEPYQTCLKDK